MANFGIPDFGYQGADAQGGYLAGNVPNDPLNPTPPQMPGGAPAAQPLQGGTPAPSAAPSPLGGGPLAPGAGQTPQPPGANPEPAPAAGIGSPFAKMGGT